MMPTDLILAARRDRVLASELLADLIVELIRIPSLTGDEERMTAFLVRLLKDLEWDQVIADEHGNVIGRLRARDTSKPSVMLLSHLDTSPPGPMKLPFEPSIDPGGAYGTEVAVIRGRGAISPKGTLAAMILALDPFASEQAQQVGELILAGVTRDLAANSDGIRAIHQLGITADYVIAGEPTGVRAGIGARGVAQYAVEITGVPSHAGAPERGVNPIILLARFVEAVSQISLPCHDALGPATLTPVSVSGSGNPPATPETCSCVLDYRPLPGDDPIVMERRLAEVAEHVVREAPGASATVRLTRSMLPFSAEPNDHLVETLQRSIQTVTGTAPPPYYLTFATNGGYAQHQMGASVVCFGAGSITDVGANEYVGIPAVADAMEVLGLTIRRLAGWD